MAEREGVTDRSTCWRHARQGIRLVGRLHCGQESVMRRGAAYALSSSSDRHPRRSWCRRPQPPSVPEDLEWERERHRTEPDESKPDHLAGLPSSRETHNIVRFGRRRESARRRAIFSSRARDLHPAILFPPCREDGGGAHTRSRTTRIACRGVCAALSMLWPGQGFHESDQALRGGNTTSANR